MQEVWKTITEISNMYQVSNTGKVKSFTQGIEKDLKCGIQKNGYKAVQINGRSYGVHQLVAIAFLDHKTSGLKLVVDHIDENRTNNNVSNLRIVTNRYNVYRVKKNFSSKYKGVCWRKDIKKWQARITIKNKLQLIGYFTCEICAHLAYLNEVKKIEISDLNRKNENIQS
jgi:hypothetical protein